MRVELQDRGVMCTDYFCGTSGVMLSLSIDNKTTAGQIIDRLESEINDVWDHIEYTAEFTGFNGDIESAIDEELASIKDQNKNKMDNVFMPDLEFTFEDMEEGMDYPVLIITIEFLEEN